MRFSESTANVFLCHSSVDQKFVRRLAADLVKLDVRVWYAEWDVRPGDSLHESIGSALQKSHYICVVISPDSVKSKWCREELNQALAQQQAKKGHVVPLLLRDAPMPAFLQDKLRIDFRKDYYVALAQLVGSFRPIDTMLLSAALAEKPPKSLRRVRKVLAEADVVESISLGASKWKMLLGIIRAANVRVKHDDIVRIGVPGRRRDLRAR